MEFLERASVLLALAEALRANGSWTGETHIQKSTYFLENLVGVPLDFDFILYKYGPYSFDLSGELTAMQANDILTLHLQPYPYGPSYVPGSASRLLKASYGHVAAGFADQINFVAARLGPKPVSELEKIATAFYVSREQRTRDRAARIHELKPHVLPAEAERAVEEFDRIRIEAQDLGLAAA
jgi:hypothetical protein